MAQDLPFDELFQLLGSNPLDESALSAAYIHFEKWNSINGMDDQSFHLSSDDDPSIGDHFHRFATFLRPSLRSSSGTIRRTALRLLAQLWPSSTEEKHLEEETNKETGSTIPFNPIMMLYEAEQCPADFQHYRQRAQLFRRLKRPTLLTQMATAREELIELAEKLVLDVLFAQYYERFTLFWPLLTECTESYAQKSSLNIFWECYASALDFAWNALSEKGEEADGRNSEFSSYRIQMLRLLSKLPAARPELHTRYLAPKLISLYRDEFMQFDEPSPSAKPDELLDDEPLEDEEAVGSEGILDENLVKWNKKSSAVPLRFRTGRRNVVQALNALLNVFSHFSNPLGVYMERAVHAIYYELLLVNDPDLQRGALNCLFTYKYAWLTPYKVHLEGLLDERRLKEQLVLFEVDNRQNVQQSENALVDQHRAELIPVLLRLLYGSLHTHVASRGKAKRLAIFRFLANCHSDELDIFLRLLFGPLISLFEFIDDRGTSRPDIDKTLDSLSSKRDIVHSVSPNKLKGVLGSLTDVFRFLGPSLNDDQLEMLFSALLLTASMLLHRLQWLQEIGTGEERFLKNMRKLLCLTLIKFFRAFQFRSQLPMFALNSFFNKFIVLLISNQTNGTDGDSRLILPASIIRLFCTWSRIQRYVPLLNVPISLNVISDDLSNASSILTTPISLLCDQLPLSSSPSKAKASSQHLDILRVICSLLESQDEQQVTSDLQSLLPQAQPCLPDNNQSIALPFGTRLLLSGGHLDKILTHLSSIIQRNNGQVQVGRLPTIYFDLLGLLSTHIRRPEFGALFAQTLLCYVTDKRGTILRRRQDKAITILGTLTRLSHYLENPLEAISRFAPLFSLLEGRQIRESLTRSTCSLLNNGQFPLGAKHLLENLEALESWDARRIEEPDADRRCEALIRLHDLYERRDEATLLKDGAFHLLPLLAHSHAHSILQNFDISLRGTAANTLRQLIQFTADPKVAEQFDSSHLVRAHLVPLTVHGLRAEGGEAIRHEFIQCLATLVRHFPNETQLASLKCIGSAMGPGGEVVDPDLDFFECVLHIQLHRRQRAFHRLAQRLDSGELSINHSILLRFVAPIVEPYLMETASSKSALADQSLRLFTAILRRAPWNKYYQMLEHYLRQLGAEEERTKGAIRVIVAVLDAFHFDLREFKPHRQEEAKSVEAKLVRMEEETNVDMQEDGGEEEELENEEKMIKEDENGEKQRIYDTVIGKLLPRMRECMNLQDSFKHQSHRHAQQHQQNGWKLEEEKLLRAPLTLAALKLLKWLPQRVAEQHLHGIVLTINHLLMSRSPSIRQSARKLMEQMIRLLGPEKLSFVIRELKQTMNKGYQIHVMTVTVHALVAALEGIMRAGDMDGCLKDVMDVCRSETFGGGAKIGANDESERSESMGVPEARAANSKTGNTLTLIGRFVSGPEVVDAQVLGLLRDVAESSPRTETMRKLADWLRLLSVGLRVNAGIPAVTQLQWSLRLLRDNLRQMCVDEQRRKGALGLSAARRPAHCLLLAPEPKRLGVIHRVAVKSKVHVFVEFALQLLADQLVRVRHLLSACTATCDEEDKDMEEEQSQNACAIEEASASDRGDSSHILALLEQFVPLLVEAIKQKYDKIIALCLRSLLHLFKLPICSLKERTAELVDRFFVLFADYSSMGHTGGGRSNVIELQQHLFKCFTQLIKNASTKKLLTGTRLQLLFNYVETDILDIHKQATAFNLVKTIIGQKIEDKSVSNIITYLSELAITSFSANIRAQCRQTVLLYLTVHPRGQRQYERWMDFFLNQCEYELEDGRLSALEMVHAILSEFTEEANARYALLVHMKLCARLLNEESERCKQFTELCLRQLLCSITEAAFNDCLAATTDWLEAKKPLVRLLAWRAFAQLVSSDTPLFGTAQLKQLIERACQEVSAPTQLFDEMSDATKTALCELFKSVADRGASEELVAHIFRTNPMRKVLFQTMEKHKRSRSRNANVSDELIANPQDEPRTINWIQFFANLEHCLVRCQRNALNIPVSLTAGTFLSKWLDNSKCRDTVIQRLSGRAESDRSDGNTEQRLAYSPLCSLCLSLVTQLDPKRNKKRPKGEEDVDEREEMEVLQEGEWNDILVEQAIRSLAHLMPSLGADHFDLACKRLSKLCWAEAVKEPDRSRKRFAIFKLVGALAAKLPNANSTQFDHLCSYFIPLIYREMSKKSPKFTEELHSLATELGGQFRNKIGDSQFTNKLAQCQRERAERIQRRRREAKTLFVTDPAAAVAKKQKRHDRKKEAKKRRLDFHKPYRALKRRRAEQRQGAD